ncbi:MAG: hypothetical protein J7K26_02300 [Candidatus Aenigmarchaeota archaeon]|nr:hypothetical protein [Candidatus Aenigmarchaeota archaeon]
MDKIVKCPKCGLEIRTRGKHYFICYHCQMRFDIEKCQIKNFDEFRYKKRKKVSVLRAKGGYITIED